MIDDIIASVISSEEREGGPLYLTPTVYGLIREASLAAYERGRNDAIESAYTTRNKLDVTWQTL